MLISVSFILLLGAGSSGPQADSVRDFVFSTLPETPMPEVQKQIGQTAREVAPYFGDPQFLDSVNSTLIDGIIAFGFESPLPEAVAYIFERKGEFALANAARLGANFLVEENEQSLLAVQSLLGTPYFSSEPHGLALEAKGNLAAAEAYFVGRGAFTQPDVAMFFDFLGRKFGLSWAPQVTRSFRAYHVEPYYREWQRVIVPGYFSDRALLGASRPEPWISPLNWGMFNALYCDRVQMRQDFFARAFWMSLQDGYDLTHAALALEWAREQGCIGNAELGDALRDAQIARILTQAAATTVADDLFFELIATLYYIGARAQVEERWLTRIIQAQLPDGSWAERPGGESNDHSSFLAYWALLEATHANTPRVPMIAK